MTNPGAGINIHTPILLTGGTGFLGRNLLTRLLSDGWPVILLKRSSSDTALIESALREVEGVYDTDHDPLYRVFQEQHIAAIIHCATNYGRAEEEPTEIIEANLTLPMQLIQLARRYESRCFINSDTILDKKVNFYSLSKRQFVDWLPYFSSRLLCANVALEHFFGPGDDPSKFVTKIIRDLLRDVEKIDLTPGFQKRDFIFIDDVVDAYIKVLHFALSSQPGICRFEVGSGQVFELRQFVKLVKKLTGNIRTHLNFGALPYRPNEVMVSHTDIASLRGLGWAPEVSLEDGLRRTIEHERGNIDI